MEPRPGNGAESTYRRPRMSVTPDTAFWLEGAVAGELRIQRCAACRHLRHPPRPMCPACNALEWDFVVAAGHGSVYSYVTYHHQPIAGPPVPYTVLLVELDEGVRVVGNLLGDQEDVAIGMPVDAVFIADAGDDLVVPQWRPSTTEAPR